MVKRISPSPSPSPTPPVIPSTATRVIQLGNRFIRPQVAAGIRGGATVRLATPTTSNIIVRTSTAPNATANGSAVQWPSQPLSSPQLQDLFQRPRAPAASAVHRIQGPIVRTILVPRPATAASAALGGGIATTATASGTNLTVTVPPQQQQQQSPAVNTPLPNIQLPSEPVPISPQVHYFAPILNEGLTFLPSNLNIEYFF